MCEKGPGYAPVTGADVSRQKAVPGSNLEKSRRPHWRSRRQLNRISLGPSRLVGDTRFSFLSRHEKDPTLNFRLSASPIISFVLAATTESAIDRETRD